jgi:hypothetical protein
LSRKKSRGIIELPNAQPVYISAARPHCFRPPVPPELPDDGEKNMKKDTIGFLHRIDILGKATPTITGRRGIDYYTANTGVLGRNYPGEGLSMII